MKMQKSIYYIKRDLIMLPSVPVNHLFIFSARLGNNLRYYVCSRNCLDDFERLFALLISDKLKSCLPAGALNYILSLAGNDWFDPPPIGELADTYVHTIPYHIRLNNVADIRNLQQYC